MNSKKITERFYAAYAKDEGILLNSSSGGMFTVLSDFYLKSGNAVVCCIYDSFNDKVHLRLVTSVEERNRARGSKYIQSTVGDTFKECEEYLKDREKRIIFFGTGCQAAGFMKYMALKGLESQIVVVDIICHGVPSPSIWYDYINRRKEKTPGTVEYLSFRDKRTGWEASSSIVRINQTDIDISDYKKYMYGPMTLRPSCYTCKYAKIVRDSDLTIGDFWGIKEHYKSMYNPKGVSVVIVHSEQGMKLLETISDDLVLQETKEEYSVQPNLQGATTISSQRKNYMKTYVSKGFNRLYRKYADTSFYGKLKRKIFKFLHI